MLQVSTHTRTLSLNHTLFLQQPAHTHSRSLSLSVFSLSLSLSLARSLTLSFTHTCTRTISLAHPPIHSNCTHSLSLRVVCLLSLLLAVFCVHSLHLRHSCVCQFSLSTNAHAPGTPTPGRMGGLLCKPIYFDLIQIRICRACAPSSVSLVLTSLFGYFVPHSQPESHREHLSVFMLTQIDYSYVEVCIHCCVELSLTLSLALSLFPYLSRPFQSMHAEHIFSTLAFTDSLSLSLPPSFYLSLSPAFSASLPSFQIQSPNPLFLSPTTLPLFCSYSSVFVHVSILIHIYRHTGCHKMRVGRVLETLDHHLK